MTDSMTNGAKAKAPIPTILQAVTIAAVVGGAGVSKDAYDDLQQEVTASKLEMTRMRVMVESMTGQRDAAEVSAEVARSRIEQLDLRLTALEVQIKAASGGPRK